MPVTVLVCTSRQSCVVLMYVYMHERPPNSNIIQLGILGKLRSQALGEVILNVVVVPVVLLHVASVHTCMERERRKQEKKVVHERIQTKEENSKSENQQGPGASFSRPHPSAGAVDFICCSCTRWGIRPSLIGTTKCGPARPVRLCVRLHPSGYHLDPSHPSKYITASKTIPWI